ncbi:glycoside hydrolase family 5 protein [Sphingomonas sp.]|uniref:glycoside hydrolase family 5 protein n=1 Tax=Sphingomonas sp. TaxID=28214 RepID=UPI001B0F0F34|nr:glycoside hydrolase family 5 protein [Sphingomonas sp.]MBO9713837.1 glycoside hydrolase family 5 protein [Sphingomonas sp.]
MRLFTLIAAALALTLPACNRAAPPPAEPTYQGKAWAAAAKLRRGVSILSHDPIWRTPEHGNFQMRHLKIIKEGGFDFVRIVVLGLRRMDANNQLDPVFLGTLDRVIHEADAAGLSVIIDEHDFNECSRTPDICEPKLIAFWEQIGERYKNAPDNVLFELLNEPHEPLDADRWNAMLGKLIPVVRRTNPDRTLVIGPTHWNNLAYLPKLELPQDDRNIIVTFHDYEPKRFTHQGARWVKQFKDLKGIDFTPEDEARISDDFDQAVAWSKENDRPIMLGEFGAYDESGTPIEARARYTAYVRQQAEARKLPWSYWQFDGDFVVWDMKGDHWVEPIRAALIPSVTPKK